MKWRISVAFVCILCTSTAVAGPRPPVASPEVQMTALPDAQEHPLLTPRTSALPVMRAGGNRLVALQNNDGGWDWPLDDGDPNSSSPTNTIGPIGMGLAKAYEATGDPNMLAALQQVSSFLLAKTNNFSTADGYLAAELDAVFGGTTHVDYLNAHFYGPLAAGTYDRNGAGTLYDTASYVSLIRTSRASQGIPNLAAWDLGMATVSAALCGADTSDWVTGVEAEIDELDPNDYYDVIGLAGAVYGLAVAGVDYDPQVGAHASADSTSDLAAILATYQITSGSGAGGFTWNSNYVIPDDLDETIQETAYAVLALREVGGYSEEILSAARYMRSVQLATGGWRNWEGSTQENNEVTAEALWGIAAGSNVLELVRPDCPDDAFPGEAGYQVSVQLTMHDLTQDVTGFQAFVTYDTGLLHYRGDLSSYTTTPFGLHINAINQADDGHLTLSGNTDFTTGQPPTHDDALLATLVFDVPAECVDAAVAFETSGGFHSELSYMGVAAATTLIDTGPFTLDDTPPTITCSITGGDVDANCEKLVTFEATVTDNCCMDPNDVDVAVALTSGNATFGTPSITKTLSPDGKTVTVTGSVLVSDLTGCPAIVELTVDAVDCCDNAAATCTATAEVNDTINPTITCAVTSSGDVDANCESTVTFSATIEDNCCVDASAVTYTTGITANATLTINSMTVTQVDQNTVTISGSGTVSALTGCPATVTFTVDATDCCGNVAAQCVSTVDIYDNTAPVVTCNNVTQNADAGGCDALVTLVASATDNCDTIPGSEIVFTIDDDNNGFDPNDPTVTGSGSTYTFPAGSTSVRAGATDDCGNTGMCVFTVTIDAVTVVNVDITLAGVTVDVTRCIHFQTDDCTETDVDLSFTAGNYTGPVEVPCGNWTMLCVKDEQHTLWDTATLTINGVEFDATAVTLDGGDTDNDGDVDINDVTWFLYQYSQAAASGGCPWDGTRDADFSNNGLVGTEDYSMLTPNWLRSTACACTPSPATDDGLFEELAARRLPVALDASDLPEEIAKVVDLNADGVIDFRDVRLFEDANGLPHDLSDVIRAEAEQAGNLHRVGARPLQR